MGVAILANPPAALRSLPAHDAGILNCGRNSAKSCKFSVRCFAGSVQTEQKKELDADLMRNQSPKSGNFSRCRTLKRPGKKGNGRKGSVVAPEVEKLGFDQATVAALEQMYMGSPSLGTVGREEEDEEAAVSGREERTVENGGSEFAAVLDSANALRKSQEKDGCIDTGAKVSDIVPNSAGEKGRRRKNLTMRLSRRNRVVGEDQDCLEARSSSAGVDDSAKNRPASLFSERVDELLRLYGGNVNVVARNWLKLRSELLTTEEEQWLASLMKPSKALNSLKVRLEKRLSRDPSDEEWVRAAKMDLHTLKRCIDVGRAARNKIVQLNLRLVVHQARKYDWEGCSLSVPDLCQEGIQGLMTAVDKFEPSKGARFSTYAVYWIRNSILRAQTRSGYPMRSPFNVAELKLHIKKMTLELVWELGRAPTTEEIIKRVGIDKLRYKMVMRTGKKWVSLHARQRLTGHEFIDNVKDQKEDAQSKLGGAGDAMLRLGIDDMLDSLKAKESLVLRQRFGLDGKGERSLSEIGRNLRMSKEMARKYEARGLLKLKHPTRLAYLRSFLPTSEHSSV